MRNSPIRYKRLGYVGLQVTNLENSLDFYLNKVGLNLVSKDSSTAKLRCSEKPSDVTLHQGSEPGLSQIGMEVENDKMLDTAFKYLSELGYEPNWLSDEGAKAQQFKRAFSFRNHDTRLELIFYSDPDLNKSPFNPELAAIERLGHIVLNVSSYAAAHKFWVEDLGFEISDHVPGKIAFLRAYPNPLHHSFALVEGDKDGLNHVNFMVSDIDDIGKGMNRMKKADIPIVFGPGRHFPSESIFLYFLDPDGMTVEYSFGMEEIPETSTRKPRELEPRADVLDTWGSIPDPRFGSVGTIVTINE